MSTPFQPADGEKARWRYCYDLVAQLEPDDEVTYQQVEDMLDCDRTVALSAMRDAAEHLESDGLRTVKNVRQYGWVVVGAVGNLELADQRRRKSGRSVMRMVRVLQSTRREELSQIERARHDFLQRSAVASAGLFSRRPKALRELQQESKEPKQLPFRKGLS